ncbi:MAG: methyltransferase domain-containing protein [Sphingomonas sp.]
MLRRVPGLRALARGARYLVDAEYRDAVNLRLFHRDALFQTSTQTWLGRYPHLFACLTARLGDGAGLRVLSFGCSTGAEVLALRKALPKADITGIDISAHAIRAARRNAGGPRVRFVRGGRVSDAGDALYDAILCVAVLQRGELTELRPEDCSAFITFDKFERAIVELDAHLRPGGLLALHHSNFRLADTRVGANYTPILSSPPHAGDRATYGPDNRLLTGAPDRSILFVKAG